MGHLTRLKVTMTGPFIKVFMIKAFEISLTFRLGHRRGKLKCKQGLQSGVISTAYVLNPQPLIEKFLSILGACLGVI